MTPEGKVEAHLKRRVRELGGEVRKLGWIGRANAPDRLVMLPYALHALRFSTKNGSLRHPLVELKAPGVKPSAAQLREHERLRNAGFTVLVLDSVEAVDLWFGPNK